MMRKVLVADDNMVSLKILQMILERNGYDVIAAKDGLDAWETLRTNPHIHLAILDWMMPGLNGVEICQKLQREHKAGMVYVILVTAKEGTDNVIYALHEGANDYITKPFEKEELLARLCVGERIIDLQNRLTQAQKLESIGQLAAGIAHEINTPAQYVSDNITFLQDGFNDLAKLLAKYKEVLDAASDVPAVHEMLGEVNSLIEEIDEAYLMEEIPRAIEQSSEGVSHVADIVRAMKQFAHPGTDEKESVDINKAIESSITVTRNNWKYTSDIQTDFDPNMPLVPCFPGELNQVILNLIVNAADAITDTVGQNSEEKGLITISTQSKGGWAEIRIKDTGGGIPDAIQNKVFDPFFTTKQVGKGSGQGLAIAYDIIVDKHAGTIGFETKVGKGTTFIIRLPLESVPEPKKETAKQAVTR